MNKKINTIAPMFAIKEITIEAPVEKVWDLQTNIKNWPHWQPDITSTKLDGPLTIGSIFRWKAKGLNIVSTIHTLEPQKEIGWTGVSLGMFAIHNWRFESQGSNTTVITEESLSGWLTRLLKMFDPHFLEKSLEGTLNLLKAQVEQKI